MNVRQVKGKNHLRYIKRKGMIIWKKTGHEKGLWEQCLKAALKNHCLKIQKENIKKQLVFNCDENGWIG